MSIALQAILEHLQEQHPDCSPLCAPMPMPGRYSLLMRELAVGRARYVYPALTFVQPPDGNKLFRWLAGKSRELELADPATEFPLDTPENYQIRFRPRPTVVEYSVCEFEHSGQHPARLHPYTCGGRRTRALWATKHYPFPLVRYQPAVALRVGGKQTVLHTRCRLDPNKVYMLNNQLKSYCYTKQPETEQTIMSPLGDVLTLGSPISVNDIVRIDALLVHGEVALRPSPDAPIKVPFNPTRKLFLYRHKVYYGLTYTELFGFSVRDSPLSRHASVNKQEYHVHPALRMLPGDQAQIKAVLRTQFELD